MELLHNFSLIHDDIQDNSPLRRGRPTVWVKWGVAQAINTGDVLFTLAFQSIQDLGQALPPEDVLLASMAWGLPAESRRKRSFFTSRSSVTASMTGRAGL